MSAPARAAFREDVLERLAWLDLWDAQRQFERRVDPDAPWYTSAGTSLEYRRFLLLRLTYPHLDIPAPALIDRYWRLHAADQPKFANDCASLVAGTGISPDTLAPPPQPCPDPIDQSLRDLYQSIFPCGDADLWGWPPPEPGRRNGPPSLGSIHLRLPAALDESTREELRREAIEQPRHESIGPTPIIERGSVSGGFGRYRWAHAGPVMQEMHWRGSVSRLIAEQTGAIVVPGGVYYNYYRCGDSISVHTDCYGHEFALLALLSGPVEPVHCHLELANTPLEEIGNLSLATGGCPSGSTPFEVNAVPFLFSGHHIPHHREPVDRDDEVVVLIQFYALLLP